MITVPDDLVSCGSHLSIVLPQASIVDYKTHDDVEGLSVLVVRPTIVLVRSGVKKFASVDTSQLHFAKAGSMIAFRSGAHMMSEFCREESVYQSYIVSFDREFLKQTIGMSSDVGGGSPRSVVAGNMSEAQWKKLCNMPELLESLSSETEREFRLREFVIQAMADPIVRNMFYAEVVDWGESIESRLSSVVYAHYLSPLSVADLAQLSGMSHASFKRYFRSIFDESPGKWLQRNRLDHAHALAKKNELRVQEICEASGYKDVSSFIRAFSRRFGQTPSSIKRGEVAG